MIALTENGPLPDSDRMLADGALRAWNCTWHGPFVCRHDEDGRTVLSEPYTERDVLRKVHAHPLTVTCDELPDLGTYPVWARAELKRMPSKLRAAPLMEPPVFIAEERFRLIFTLPLINWTQSCMFGKLLSLLVV